MYGDGDAALSSDSTPISPSNPKHLPLMESEYGQHLGCNNTCGLLRFRSAPNSLLANFPEESPTMGFARIRNDATNCMNGNLNDDKCNKGFGRVNSQLPPQYPRQSGLSSIQGHRRIDSDLMRQNSSPAGLLSHLNSQNGYPGIRSYGVTDGGEDISTSSTMFKNHMNLENENGGGFPFGSWNDSSYFAENIKREADSDDPKLFVNTERSEPGIRVNTLSRHLSLPKTSAEMAKMLQLQHSVPFKVRAKRGCATHPRSIAERVRRTRISERMRKLQELVPNMDKQTNTADMLDFAVEYIKSLQKQYKTLDDLRANCNCLAFSKC